MQGMWLWLAIFPLISSRIQVTVWAEGRHHPGTLKHAREREHANTRAFHVVRVNS
jgi:hypothetical protein